MRDTAALMPPTKTRREPAVRWPHTRHGAPAVGPPGLPDLNYVRGQWRRLQKNNGEVGRNY
jgi:hypothetical protein